MIKSKIFFINFLHNILSRRNIEIFIRFDHGVSCALFFEENIRIDLW